MNRFSPHLTEKVHPYLSAIVLIWAVVITTILSLMTYHAEEKTHSEQKLFSQTDQKVAITRYEE